MNPPAWLLFLPFHFPLFITKGSVDSSGDRGSKPVCTHVPLTYHHEAISPQHVSQTPLHQHALSHPSLTLSRTVADTLFFVFVFCNVLRPGLATLGLFATSWLGYRNHGLAFHLSRAPIWDEVQINSGSVFVGVPSTLRNLPGIRWTI